MKYGKWVRRLVWIFILISFILIYPTISPLFIFCHGELPTWLQEAIPQKDINFTQDAQGNAFITLKIKEDRIPLLRYTVNDARLIAQNSIRRRMESIKNPPVYEILWKPEEATLQVKFSGLSDSNHPRQIFRQLHLYGIFPTFLQKIMPSRPIKLGLDLRGGAYLVYEVELSQISDESAASALKTTKEIIEKRVNAIGLAESLVQIAGSNRIEVQLPGEKDVEKAKAQIGPTARLEFRLVHSSVQVNDLLGPGGEIDPAKIPAGYEVLPGREKGEFYLVGKGASVTGEDLKTAMPSTGEFSQPQVGLEFTAQGALKFEKVTGENVGRQLAIVLDGEIYSAPVIDEKISGGNAVIRGKFTMTEVATLVNVLVYGALPASIRLIEERTVGPTLGRDSIRSGLWATMVGFIVVIGFMVFYYKFSGLIADIALILNLLFLIAIMATLGSTLTLPGIAGILLTIGMAVDANVLIFERIREELRGGKTVRSGIDNGYQRAFSAIVDSNLTTVLTAVALYLFGTGPVKGFAITLIFGLMISMFTAIIVTRIIFDYLYASRPVKVLSI